MKFISILGLVLSGFCLAGAGHAKFDQTHAQFAAVLEKHVIESGGGSVVRYAALKKDRSGLDAYLKEIAGVRKAEYETFSRKDRLAFLINAYNAYTLRFIIDHYPVESIRKLRGGLFTGPWKRKEFLLFGEKVHLDHIEHELIRKNFREPRIHFAVNCASIGCPALRRFPYQGRQIDSQLGDSARMFLTDESRNRYDASRNILYLSKIFDWYGDDFVVIGGKKPFVIRFMAKSKEEEAKMADAKIKYLDYDWKLNDAANVSEKKKEM